MKLSEVLEGSLKDYDILSEQPNIFFNMDDWHVIEDGICTMCLGGAFLHTHGYEKCNFSTRAFRRGGENWMDELPEHYQRAIRALNTCRVGFIDEAFQEYYSQYIPYRNIDVECHVYNPRQWRLDMNRVLERVKKIEQEYDLDQVWPASESEPARN